MLTKKLVTSMFELQRRLNERVNPNWKNAGNDWSLAIIAECVELVDQIGWKWWKHQPRAPLTQIHLEVVDIWHFVMSAIIEADGVDSATEYILDEPDCENDPVDDGNRAIQRAKWLIVAATLYPPHKWLAEFFGLMRSVRLSSNDLYNLYMAKTALNLFRWENGYKEGSYIKDWFGEEDSVFLEKTLANNPGIDLGALNAKLRARYSQVRMNAA